MFWTYVFEHVDKNKKTTYNLADHRNRSTHVVNRCSSSTMSNRGMNTHAHILYIYIYYIYNIYIYIYIYTYIISIIYDSICYILYYICPLIILYIYILYLQYMIIYYLYKLLFGKKHNSHQGELPHPLRPVWAPGAASHLEDASWTVQELFANKCQQSAFWATELSRPSGALRNSTKPYETSDPKPSFSVFLRWFSQTTTLWIQARVHSPDSILAISWKMTLDLIAPNLEPQDNI